MNWFIGQKVVCIRNDFVTVPPIVIQRLTIGTVYTIRGFNLAGPDCPDLAGSGVGFYLEEAVNQMYLFDDGKWHECSYDQIGFRPATNISVFRKLLKSVSTPKKAISPWVEAQS